MTDAITLPRRSRGRQSPAAEQQYERERKAFCEAILEINSGLDFKVSSRGWAYILEEHGLAKGDFDAAQRLINKCRKDGSLPVDICAEDEGRAVDHLEKIDEEEAEDFAQGWVDYLQDAHEQYTPYSFWDDLDTYVEMTVEKIDLKSLFAPICRFAHWERQGKRIVLLHCGDHDPGGLHISEFIRSNLEDVAKAAGWHPRNLEIDRFGLNYGFIQAQRLTWIDNLETGSGERLDDPQPQRSLQGLCPVLFERVRRTQG